MLINYIERKESQADVEYIKVSANVRHWEDAEINGESSEDGLNVPFKNGDLWEPVIDVNNGIVIDWPQGTEAKFHFKICDAGSYHLLDRQSNVILSIDNNYVPSGLCHGDRGFGDYIIFNVNKDGSIVGYSNCIDVDDWIESEED